MDLCNKTYGFLHLPSLFVLLNPYAHSPDVRRFFIDGTPVDQLPAFIPTLSPAEAAELLQRLTCYVHERKHFHDLLVTPYGNAIVRHAFRAAFVTSTVWADRVRTPGERPLPLDESSVRTAELLPRAWRIYRESTGVFAAAIATLEASATLAQRQFAWTHFGLDSVERLDDDFTRDPRYSAILTEFWKLAERLHGDVPDIGVALHRLLLISLGGGPSVGEPDATLKTLLARFASMPDRTLKARLVAALEGAWRVMVANMQRADTENDEFYDRIDRVIRRDDDAGGLAAIVRAAFDEFRRSARDARKQVLADERTYIRLDGYVDFAGDLIEPCLYHYSVVDEDSLSEQPVDLSEGEFAAQHVYRVEGGRTLYSHRVSPADVSLGKRTMDRRVWTDFMQSVGGSVALLEEVDWLHPAKTLWLRHMETATGIRFVRRRSRS